MLLSGVLLAQRSHSGKTAVTSDTLFQQLRSVSQLTTVEYHYTNMGKFEKNADLNGWTIPLTKASFILAYDGKITAGVRLDDVQIDVQDKTITITLPPAEILSHEVDEASIEVYDESIISLIRSVFPTMPHSPSNRKRSWRGRSSTADCLRKHVRKRVR